MTYTQRIEKKIQTAKETEWNPTKSELQKVIKAAQKRSGCEYVMIESFFCGGVNEHGFVKAEFHVYNALTDERLDDVMLDSYVVDRRRSWVY